MISTRSYLKPTTVEEAVSFAVANENDFRFLAGGTDVIVNAFQGNDMSSCLIDITGISEMKRVTRTDTHLKIGSLMRLDDLKNVIEIINEFPTLIQAAHEIASPMLRKTATLGGNILCENRCIFYNQNEWWREAVGFCLKCDGDICIATGGKKNCFSKFVSDSAPVLISMDAQLELIDANGIRTIPLESIFTGDGLNPRNLSKTALIKNIVLPLGQNYKVIFKKLRPREAVDFTSLTTAVSLNDSGKIRIVLGGVDPKPIIVEGNITNKIDDLIKLAIKKARIVDNDYYSRLYRKEMISVYLERSFDELHLL